MSNKGTREPISSEETRTGSEVREVRCGCVRKRTNEVRLFATGGFWSQNSITDMLKEDV